MKKGFNMKSVHTVVLGLIVINFGLINAQPVITKMFNNSDFVYQVIEHNGAFGCNKALKNQPFLLNAKSFSDEQILIGLQFPSVKLRPIAYLDAHSSKLYSFVDSKNNFDYNKIHLAFNVWKIAHKTEYKCSKEWFENWVGGDIVIHHNYVEVLGYVMNLSKVVVANKKHANTSWVQWSQGVFARLSLGVTIQQNLKKGVIPFVESYVGEGALCKDGVVEDV